MVSVPSTKVAESAEVMKKVPIKKMAMSDMTVPMGYCSNTVNSRTSMPSVSIMAFRGVSWNNSNAIPVPPKTVNQNAQKSDGTRNTPNTN